MIILFAYVRSSLIYADMLDLRMFASNYILIPIFGFFVIGLSIYILNKDFSPIVNQTLNIISLVIFGFLFSQIGLFLINDESFDEAQRLLHVPIFEMEETLPTPNVYLILLELFSNQVKNDQNRYILDDKYSFKVILIVFLIENNIKITDTK